MFDNLSHTPLYDLHVELGAEMTAFAGWAMPVRYPMGIMAEHLHCRAQAGLFDVSHMGQIRIACADASARSAALAMEALVPADLAGLADGRQRYALLTDAAGGVRDDLMVARHPDDLVAVVNAACRDADLDHIASALAGTAEVTLLVDRALLALQGPGAEAALEAAVPGVAAMRFMDVATFDGAFGRLWISRSGYTGEDGFEISVHDEEAEALARTLLAHDAVAPIGLGARDSLRLEAGMPLYGTDLDRSTSPVEAGLAWSIGKARRPGGARAGGFPGAERILDELARGPDRRRVGLLPEGRAPMRGGTRLFADPDGDTAVGAVSSGGYGPSLAAPIAMGYVEAGQDSVGTQLYGEVRGRRLPVAVAPLPFRAPGYRR